MNTSIEFATMVEYENSVLLVGGKDDQYLDHGLLLWQLKSPLDKEWIHMHQNLDDPRIDNTAFLVPNKMMSCD